MSKTDVAIVGAGPYGLSLAASLAATGVDVALFGRPMAFWETIARAAPERYLKSYCFGADIPVPEPVSFSDWSRARGLESFEPCAMSDFVDYGLDVQRRYVPFVNQAPVENVRASGSRFLLRTESGEEMLAERVVVATGLACFEHVPRELAALSSDLVRHSNAIASYAVYRGKRVAVVGGGQSALEAAALVHEAGGEPELIVRERFIRWMSRTPRERSLLRKLRSPISGLGSGPKAWVLTNLPGACRLLPDGPRIEFLRRHLPPEGAWWLRPRVDGVVSTRLATVVRAAATAGAEVVLTLATENEPDVEGRYDSVIAATGFRADIDRLPFLGRELRDRIRRIDGAPRLDRHFQSSAAGLHFVGPASAASFGPLFRFVVGAHHTTATLVGHIADKRRKAA
ncbi:MAG TPA: NAD(P)-binding domain-containing protein [Candidatus Cybelea sp.]|nr:NAD(P)-binding domain-containing protein [Candidatus Cybelea sp.]